MPKKIKHIEQYKKNKLLANSKCLNNPQFRDWKIVMIFYAAMHYLESSYADKYHSTTHQKRKKYLESDAKYEDIIDDYENLEMLSRKSRYDCIEMSSKEVIDALVNLKSIEDFVDKNCC